MCRKHTEHEKELLPFSLGVQWIHWNCEENSTVSLPKTTQIFNELFCFFLHVVLQKDLSILRNCFNGAAWWILLRKEWKWSQLVLLRNYWWWRQLVLFHDFERLSEKETTGTLTKMFKIYVQKGFYVQWAFRHSA